MFPTDFKDQTEQATREGWCISTTQSAFEPYQLQRIDEAEVFHSDDAVYNYVCSRAAQGSEYHISALLWLREHSPYEYHNLGPTLRAFSLEN